MYFCSLKKYEKEIRKQFNQHNNQTIKTTNKMKKMNNIYEAPKAEVIEIQNVSILMSSTGGGTGNGMGGFQP